MYECQHWRIFELVDRETYRRFGERAWMFFDKESLLMIDGIREYFDAPMIINDWYWFGNYEWSGLRTIGYMGGSEWSFHRLAKGFDIKCKYLSAENMRTEILANQNHKLLKRINRMEAGRPWLHVDRANIKNRIEVFCP